MSIINARLSNDLVNYHSPTLNANLAVMVVDEIDKWLVESEYDAMIRREKQSKVLETAKNLGCRSIVVNQYASPKIADFILDVIDEPDFTCVKKRAGVLASETQPKLLPFIKENNITSIVAMGGAYNYCMRDSLIGRLDDELSYSGLLSHGITVLTSPELLSPFKKSSFPIKPKFNTSATKFVHSSEIRFELPLWPDFTLHSGVRIYLKV